MRELNTSEMKEINGGLAPLIGLAVSAAGHFGARSVGWSFVNRIGYGTAVYSFAEWAGDRKKG